MKKVLALLLAVVMVIGMSTASLAAEGDPTTDSETATFTVKYTAESGTKPAEKFTFTKPTFVSVTNAGVDPDTGREVTSGPDFAENSIAAVSFSSTETEKPASIILPTFKAVGVYTYKFKENPGTKTGITYFSGDIYLVVTVIQGADGHLRVAAVHCEGQPATGTTKTDEIENTYNSGSLKVKKLVEGNLGDRNKDFAFTVTFSAGGAIETAANSDAVGTVTWNADGTEATFTLKHNGEITFSNVPADATYTVVETDAGTETTKNDDGYKTSYTYTDDQKKVAAGDVDSVTVTNTKDETIDTGIVLDSLPYILIGVAVAAAAVLMVAKKRRIED